MILCRALSYEENTLDKSLLISESLTPNQYTQTLKKGKEYSSLEAAYDAYLKALEQYDSVRQP